MATRRRSSRDPEPPVRPGCLLLLAGFVVIFILFYVNFDRIGGVLERNRVLEILTTRREAKPARNPVEPAPKIRDDTGGAGSSSSGAGKGSPSAPGSGGVLPGANGPTGDPAGGQGAGSPGTVPGTPGAVGSGAGTGTTSTVPLRTVRLYFIRIDDDGLISRHEVSREVPDTGSPLLSALTALTNGPSEEELRRRLITLIPMGTKLLGVRIQGSTAFVNFSEEFMYNRFGVEGYAGQLRQVVYTATVFPTVQDVQILIEGEIREYLGLEGAYIGRPLSRNSF